jgi:hypothetical protein
MMNTHARRPFDGAPFVQGRSRNLQHGYANLMDTGNSGQVADTPTPLPPIIFNPQCDEVDQPKRDGLQDKPWPQGVLNSDLNQERSDHDRSALERPGVERVESQSRCGLFSVKRTKDTETPEAIDSEYMSQPQDGHYTSHEADEIDGAQLMVAEMRSSVASAFAQSTQMFAAVVDHYSRSIEDEFRALEEVEKCIEEIAEKCVTSQQDSSRRMDELRREYRHLRQVLLSLDKYELKISLARNVSNISHRYLHRDILDRDFEESF